MKTNIESFTRLAFLIIGIIIGRISMAAQYAAMTKKNKVKQKKKKPFKKVSS